MIKTIYLHAGLHKTGTTTIQETLGNNRDLLKNLGYLYPKIMLNGNVVNNLSIPIYSMFINNPETYFLNNIYGYSTFESARGLNQNYTEQIRKQIESFNGEVLVISGEDISRIQKDGLESLKSFLISLAATVVEIRIILFLRHPLEYHRSIKQEMMKNGGMPKESNANYYTNDVLYRVDRRVMDLIDVFGAKSVRCLRYEDAVLNKYGLIGTFLTEIGLDAGLIKNTWQNFHNVSITYEGVQLLTAINEKFPYLINNMPNPARDGFCAGLFYPIPGVKFVLSENENRMIWEFGRPVWAEVCQWCHLPEYEYYESKPIDDSLKWSGEVMDFLIQIIPKIPEIQAETVLNVLMAELKLYQSVFSHSKKLRIFSILMFYSSVFQCKTAIAKFFLLTKNIGLLLSITLILRYKLKRRFFMASIKALQQNSLV